MTINGHFPNLWSFSYNFFVKLSPYNTIQLLFGHVVAPNFFNMEFYKEVIGKLQLWAFSYDFFVKLSLYNTIQL